MPRRNVTVSVTLNDQETKFVLSIRRFVLRCRKMRHDCNVSLDTIRSRYYPAVPLSVLRDVVFYRLWISLDLDATELSYMSQVLEQSNDFIQSLCDWLNTPVKTEILQSARVRNNKRWLPVR